MAITQRKAEALRRYVDDLTNEASEVDDTLAELEDEEVKGEDRETAEAAFESAIEGVSMSLSDLRAAFDKAVK